MTYDYRLCFLCDEELGERHSVNGIHRSCMARSLAEAQGRIDATVEEARVARIVRMARTDRRTG